MELLYFTVDAALLEELGERLVGKPYIALAELVKNSYDADSLKVEVTLDPINDRIEICDYGHGMTIDEFSQLWMRVGSTHKARQKLSRKYGRPLTGSKGVGRLAVQFLAEKLRLETVSDGDLRTKIVATVEWKEAVSAGDLTQASVMVDIESSSEEFESGTKIHLIGLKHEWIKRDIEGLAREIWWLKSPFRSPIDSVDDPKKIFEITFVSPEKDYVEYFDFQINAIMNIWYAKLVGENFNGHVSLSLEFVGEEPIFVEYEIPKCKLKKVDFEIRIFHLIRRQPHGIRVGEARKYLNEFGGIHVYDGGFHLPYYGNPRNDWLSIEITHSHRRSISQLLPREFHAEDALHLLPTLSRLFGVVNLDTTLEPGLEILITRDRFKESQAFNNLTYMVRYALDYYAFEERKRQINRDFMIKRIEKPKESSFQQILTSYQTEIPPNVYEELHYDIIRASVEVESDAEIKAKQVALMGPLATAGMATLAVQHETDRQLMIMDDIISQIKNIVSDLSEIELKDTLDGIREDLEEWVDRIRKTNTLFNYFQDPENINIRLRYNVNLVLEEIKKQVEPLAKGIPIEIENIEYSLLPEASLVEWSAIFQNLFTNAFNALLDSEKKSINVTHKISGDEREILIQDTGSGVNLSDSDTLFEPFVRRVEISPERRALGYGGMGLGLAIVRLVANNIGCEVSFVEPDEGFNTAFSIKWRELK